MANYIATDTDLVAVANAIRSKGGTSASLTFPSGYVTAINNISTWSGNYAKFNNTTTFPSCLSNTENLTEIYLSSITSLASYCFVSCTNLSVVSIPKVVTVGNYAFRYCSALTTISLPKCQTIGIYAFSGCTNLKSVYLTSTTMVALSGTASLIFPTAVKIYVPNSLLATYKAGNYWKSISGQIYSI